MESAYGIMNVRGHNGDAMDIVVREAMRARAASFGSWVLIELSRRLQEVAPSWVCVLAQSTRGIKEEPQEGQTCGSRYGQHGYNESTLYYDVGVSRAVLGHDGGEEG